MTKPLHSGNAARNGILAAQLGSRGFTAHAAAFEGTAGYFKTFTRGLSVSLDPFKDLGSRYHLVALGYSLKAYPCGGPGPPPRPAGRAPRGERGPAPPPVTQHP